MPSASSGGNPANHLFLPRTVFRTVLFIRRSYQEKTGKDCRFSDNLGLSSELAIDLRSANGPVAFADDRPAMLEGEFWPFRDHDPFGMAHASREKFRKPAQIPAIGSRRKWREPSESSRQSTHPTSIWKRQRSQCTSVAWQYFSYPPTIERISSR